MKCPKCNYVSHDYLDSCRKCGIDLVTFKQDIGLVVLQPGVLDLSLVLGGAGADDLFESVEEDVSMHASDDDDFDISLDDYAEHPEVRRAPTGIPRPGRPEPEIDLAGMDHLTLELDAADLPAAVTANLRAAQRSSDAPVPPATPPPAEPGALTLPGHVTLEMDAESISTEFPPGVLEEIVSVGPPPPQGAPAAPDSQETTASLRLDMSHLDFARLTSATTPETESSDEARAESVDETIRVTDFSGVIASLQLQDVVLADDTLAAAVEPELEVVDPTMPTIQLFDAATAFAHIDTVSSATPEESEEAASLIHDSLELSVDDSVLALEAHEPSASDMADVTEPALTTLDEPRLEDMGLLPSFEFELSTLTEAEATLSDLNVPTLGEAPLTFADEALSPTPSVGERVPPTVESLPEDILTSSDMFALEDLEEAMPPGHLTLDLDAPVLPSDLLASSLLEDATRTPLPAVPELPETRPSAGAESGWPEAEPEDMPHTSPSREWMLPVAETPPEGILTSSDMFALEDLEEAMPPGHLTLDLDAPVLPADLASSLIEDATPMSPYDTPQLPETLTSASIEPTLPPADALTFEDLDDIALPGHLTLELDSAEMASEVSSIILDSLQLENPPGDVQSRMSPGEDQADDEAELLLDLDNLEFDDDKPA